MCLNTLTLGANVLYQNPTESEQEYPSVHASKDVMSDYSMQGTQQAGAGDTRRYKAGT